MGPGRALALPGNLSSDAACKQVVENLKKHTHKLHILINNAGATWGESLEDYPEAAWAKLMTINVASVFHLTRACVPLLEAASEGKLHPACVVNISSVMGHSTIPQENAYAYSASKAAVSQLTKVLAAQFTPRGITVNAIAPGTFPSKMTRYLEQEDGEYPPEVVAMHPIGRIGNEADIAGLAIFLCSRAGAFVSGSIVPCDGGYLISASKL